MDLGHLYAATAITGLVGVASIGLAGIASATDANVTYAQTCDHATVTVTSSWDGVSHIHLSGPIPEISFDVPGHKTAGATFKIIPNPLTVTVTSSNAILHGTLTHTFTADSCGAAVTTAPSTSPPPTSCPPASDSPVEGCPYGGVPSTTATTSSTTPGSAISTAPATTVDTSPATTPADATPRKSSTPTTAKPALPATGSGDAVPLTVIAVAIIVAGFILAAVRCTGNAR